jgi:hypothetical protein
LARLALRGHGRRATRAVNYQSCRRTATRRLRCSARVGGCSFQEKGGLAGRLVFKTNLLRATGRYAVGRLHLGTREQ